MRTRVSQLIYTSVLACFLGAPAFAEPAATTPSPTNSYLSIFQKEHSAKSYADLLPFRTRESVSHDKRESKKDEAAMLELMQAIMPAKVKVVKEEINGNAAIVTVEIVTEPASNPNQMMEKGGGKVYMQMEDGQWKLEKEVWKSELKSAGQFEDKQK